MADKKVKALVLSHISELLGGAERSMLDIFDVWAKEHNVKPEFILREPVKSLAGEINKRGWHYHAVRYTFWSDGNPPTKADDIYRNWRENVKAVATIENIIKKTRPDVVMTNSLVSPWAALAAYNQKLPHIWFVREYGDLDHGRIFEIGRRNTFEDVGNLSRLVFTNSKTLAKHVSKYIDSHKVAPIYTPFDIEKLRLQASQPETNPYHDKKSLKLILTGNIARSKGQLETIKAVGELTKAGYNVELCLVGKSGDDNFSREINQTINSLGLDKKVHLVGYQANPLAFVNLADLGIMPSRMEAFGRVTFEYLALGKAVVGSNSGATPEMVEQGFNGYLFEPEQINSLASAIRNYAKRPELIAEHGKNAYKKAIFMMNGPDNVESGYGRVLEVLNNKVEPDLSQIHFLKHWADYAQNHPKTRHSFVQIKSNLRAKAKKLYHKSHNLKARVIGK